MLIYNYEKNFLGIDEQDLKALGFQNLEQLRSEVSDFADLFVKTPGYIHNFKHVHWIDFIACAESSDDSKVIIHVNNRNFKCTLDLKTAYLIDNPRLPAYLVNLQNIRELTNNENKEISSDIVNKPLQNTAHQSPEIFATAPLHKVIQEEAIPTTITNDPYEIDFADDDFDQEESLDIAQDYYQAPLQTTTKVESKPKIEEKISYSEPKHEKAQNDFKLDLDDIAQDIEEITPEDDYKDSYVYDPHVASAELGLPVDLIEEFIQDFIAQSKEFKSGLYKSLDLSDLDKLRVQSHKLKGVAANLRIENAFEVLTIINSSDNPSEIKNRLDQFYKIIATLAKEEMPAPAPKIQEKQKTVVPETSQAKIEDEDEDEIEINFKEDVVLKETPKKEAIESDADDLVLEFKDDTEDDLYMDYEDEAPKNSFKVPESLDAQTTNNDLYEFQLDEEELDTPLQEELTTKEEPTIKYDKKTIAQEIGLDIESFAELFEDYISGCKVASSDISKAIQKNNPKQWQSSASQIKGMSDNMRVSQLSDILSTLINTEDSTIASDALNKLDSLIEKISTTEA